MGYVVARELGDVWSALDAGGEVIAGGTDWFPARGDHVGEVSLIDLTALPGFGEIKAGPGGWRIGASVRWSQLIAAGLPPCFDGLKAAAGQVGSVQVQNAGTIAGNLCNASPAADGVPPLLTLGAQVECLSAGGRRVVPLEKFLLGPRQHDLRPGEIVSAILVPPQPGGSVAAFGKAGSRAYLVISIAMVAVQAVVAGGRLADLRIAVGACGPVAQRLPGLEARLEGAEQVVVAPGDLSELSPISDIRGSADYRLEVVAETTTRLLRGLV